ncbi:hypothetical protein G9A89_007232 [Geosiphon pyriformis]|nr:hypothetical protein G9A89_007232 [Geosiphon pyriformis]
MAKPRDDVLDIAFTVPFSSNIDYIAELDRQLGSIRDSSEYFNYLAVVQSSGYGKTRAIHELAKLYPVIYLCFRSSVSTGYPKTTTHSLTLKNEIGFCDTMAEAEAVANRWLAAMVITFLDKSHVYNRVDGKKYHQHILEDRESKNQAKEFWDAVYQKKKQIDIPPPLTLNQFIIICFDEASALTETDGRKVFRAIRRALRNQRENIVGIFADTNSSIGDLVTVQDEDDSARDLKLHAHRPFVHIASTDCLRMFPVVYGSHATKRAKEINNDNDEDAKDYLFNKRWKSDEQAEQDEEWPEEYE